MIRLNCQGNLHKKGNIQFFQVECLPYVFWRHLIQAKIKCHFFITKIKMIMSSKMIEMSSKTLIINVLNFILSNLLSFVRFGRHPTTEVPDAKIH